MQYLNKDACGPEGRVSLQSMPVPPLGPYDGVIHAAGTDLGNFTWVVRLLPGVTTDVVKKGCSGRAGWAEAGSDGEGRLCFSL